MARLPAKEREERDNKILADWKVGISQNQLAKNYDVSPATINKICKNVDRCKIEPLKPFERTAYDNTSDGYVYVICFSDSSGKKFYKIGLARSVEARIKQHQTSIPFELSINMSFYVLNMAKKEKELHDMFKNKNIRGEWYALDYGDLLTIKGLMEILDGNK